MNIVRLYLGQRVYDRVGGEPEFKRKIRHSRALYAHRRRREGAKLREIGDELGVSPERAGQLARRGELVIARAANRVRLATRIGIANGGRVIPISGERRDTWHEWTPEDQYREFAR